MKTSGSKKGCLYGILSPILNRNLLISVLPLLFFLFISNFLDYIFDTDNPFERNQAFLPFVFLFIIVQCGYFILYGLEKILETGIKMKNFNWYFLHYLQIFFYLVLGFSINYWILFQIDNSNYGNVLSTNSYEQLFDFFYFSFTNITTIGSSSIIALSRTAQFYLMLEVTMGIIMLGYFLGSFSEILGTFQKQSSVFVNKNNK